MPDQAVSTPPPAVTRSTIHEVVASLQELLGDRRAAREVLSLVWDRAPGWVAARGDSEVPEDVRAAAITAARRASRGEPLAYATGRAAFRNLTLTVDERVLIPRPETEILVDEVLRVCPTGVAVDVGTGTGAIALSLAEEGSFERVIATDVSADALTVARANAVRLGLRTVEFRCGSLLSPLAQEQVDVIVSNPPYIAASEMRELPHSVRAWEPPVALVAGGDGLAHTRALIATAADSLKSGGWLLLECDSRRAGAVAALLSRHGSYSDVRVRTDLAGRPRVAVARRASATMENHN